MDEKLNSENMQKIAVFYVYISTAIRAGRCRERRYADHISIHIILQNAPFRSQIFFASGGKGALTPLTKILRTFLVGPIDSIKEDQKARNMDNRAAA